MKHRPKIALALCTISMLPALMTGMGYGEPEKAACAPPLILLKTPASNRSLRLGDGEKLSAETKAEEEKKAQEEGQEERRACDYTGEEAVMMEYIIQQEVRGASIEHKRIIANVIVNRVRSDAFPDTIEDVLFQKGQFTSAQNYYSRKYEPDEDTKQAVFEVLNRQCEDLSQGALFFYAPQWTEGETASWFENELQYLFELEGHRFFQ